MYNKIITGTEQIYGNRNKRGGIDWFWKAPEIYQRILQGGKCDLHWAKTLSIWAVGRELDEFLNQPVEYTYNTLKKYVGFYESFGNFHTRTVKPYMDDDGIEKDKYTIFMFPYGNLTEERIRKQFGYHGKKVIGF